MKPHVGDRNVPAHPTVDGPLRDNEVLDTERRHVRDWHIRVTIFESGDDTHAKAVLLADSPRHLTAQGDSRRGSDDQPVPEIGDEVAVARALRHLADQLIATAEDDIAALTGEHDVAVRPT